MPLESGARLGPYEIGLPVGAGGMGEVYRARDNRLDRTVAVKVVRGEFTDRFEREAKAISALNHPHICTLYDVGSENGIQYLVMEFVEGETLTGRLRKGPLSQPEAMRIAGEIADALDAAHSKGIAHRDLKPGNIMLTKSGVKLLDFGLAKIAAAQPSEAGATLSMSPITARHTVLGTPQYMSPEQVEGREADTRADIFAFGCVLYEMLSGRRAFDGKSTTGIMAAILEREPAPLETAGAQVDWIIRRCLEKDPDARFQSIHDVRLILDQPAAPVSSPRRPVRALTALAVAALCLAAAGAIWWKTRLPPAAPSPTLTRLTSDAGVTWQPDISPDGKLVVYASDRDNQKNFDLYVQQIPNSNPVRLTQTPEDESEPSFSPDGSSIAFSSNRAGGGIYLMPALGGDPRLLVRGGFSPRFSPDGTSVAYSTAMRSFGELTEASSKAFVVPVAGGAPRQIAPEFAMAVNPVWSPEGKSVMFFGIAPGAGPVADRTGVWIVPAEGGRPVRGSFQVSGRNSFFGPWKREGIFFSNLDGNAMNLYRMPLDSSGTRRGEPIRLTVGTAIDKMPAVARAGQMVFTSGAGHINIWALPLNANTGKVTGAPYRVSESLATQSHPRLSPDGRRLLFGSNRNGLSQLWQRDLTTGKEVLVDPRRGSTWGWFLPASGRIAYRVQREGFILDPATGESRKIYTGGYFWSINHAETIALVRSTSALANVDGLELKSLRRVPLLRAEKEQWNLYQAYFSPDDRWIVFLANNSLTAGQLFVARAKGMNEIPRAEWLPVTDGKQRVDKPRFSPDGRLIYFTIDHEASRSIHAVRFDPESGRTVGEPFLVYDFPGPRLSMAPVGLGQLEISVANDKLVTLLSEANWNIWMADYSPAK